MLAQRIIYECLMIVWHKFIENTKEKYYNDVCL